MAQPYVGEIRIFAGNFAPVGWSLCNGSLVPISQNETLFNLVGTTYGGDGQSTFALPDLRGRAPIHMGQGPGLSSYVIGQMAGVEQVTLTGSQIPGHGHALLAATSTASSALPGPSVVLGTMPAGATLYGPLETGQAMPPGMLSSAGGNQPHSNIQLSTGVSYILSLFGIFPTQG